MGGRVRGGLDIRLRLQHGLDHMDGRFRGGPDTRLCLQHRAGQLFLNATVTPDALLSVDRRRCEDAAATRTKGDDRQGVPP